MGDRWATTSAGGLHGAAPALIAAIPQIGHVKSFISINMIKIRIIFFFNYRITNDNGCVFCGVAAMLNGSERGQGHSTVQIGGGSLGRSAYTDQELWFRAATIAVPICGALILLILVLLAMKLLRSDVLEDHRIIQTKLR